MTSSLGGFMGMGDNTGSSIKGSSTGNIVPKGYRAGQLQQFSPEQMRLFSQLFSHIAPGSYLSKLAGGDEAAFSQIEGPAMRQFQSNLGNISSRFSGMGSFGGRQSSGFQNEMTAASSNFAQDLAARRQELQRQAIFDLMGLSESLLGQRPYEQYIVPKREKQGFFSSLFSNAPKETLGAIGGGIQGALGGGMFGGPMGALMGGLGGLTKGFMG